MNKNLLISAAVLLVSVGVFFTLIKPRLFAKTPTTKALLMKKEKEVKGKEVNNNTSFKVTSESMLPDEMAAVLDTTDLSIELTSPQEGGYSTIFDGFYGKDKYRISFFIEKVQKDSSDASHYILSGKTKYKDNIEPFTGEIRLNGMKKAIYEAKYEGEKSTQNYYSTVGEFKFIEQGASKGTFAGQLSLDFQGYRTEDDVQKVSLFRYTNLSEAKGAGFIMKGNWTNANGTVQKPLLLAGDLFAIANEILPEFSIGERDVEINPKYRHLGWDDYWSNKEWWNESPVQ